MKRLFFGLIVFGLVLGMVILALHGRSTETTPLAKLSDQYAKKTNRVTGLGNVPSTSPGRASTTSGNEMLQNHWTRGLHGA